MDKQRSTVRSRELGNELREVRLAAGVRGKDMAQLLNWSPAKLVAVEKGTRGARPEDIATMLAACGFKLPEVRELLRRVRNQDNGFLVRPNNSGLSDNLRALIIHENLATKLCEYRPMIVPGLLQTEDYARAIIRSADGEASTTIEQCVRTRLARQNVLIGPNAPRSTFYIHEATLQGQVGSAQIMHEQLLQLVLRSNIRSVTIRIVPFSAGGATELSSSFLLMDFDRINPVVHVDISTVSVFLERPQEIEQYRSRQHLLARLALSAEESREVLTDWADRYDRAREGQRDVQHGGADVAQEQLQRRRPDQLR
ncbi:helix-turn-helix domain-containing protein [Goodfellowiella coeruleoviolacea]|uniref:Helix-turn-helix domain-containing protein n=1 Tax=Goodfellowiella coeruleoviolacea TaxID=334858 RepID=A0AAE3GLP8_9PSEU|nr:helix-turn-helix transcriptional regulator [Goodfellowiella coeruleoviolacea]MCP2169599.1 Helix-turn-helix domain-containing protein [Goodfellowiella coeruleoviolacea]